MTLTETRASGRDPIDAVLNGPEDAVLVVIAGVEGPSYRPVGAMMTIVSEQERAGTLSSGCIEADITRHAVRARNIGTPALLRYGRGSPFADIQLPCGGGLDILLIPNPDRTALSEVAEARAARGSCALQIDMRTGSMRRIDAAPTRREGDLLTVRFDPDIRFLIFGKGPEASTFAALVQSAGYPNLLCSPDDETLDDGRSFGAKVRALASPSFPDDLRVDDRTAILLFFHDHDWEPPILAHALKTPAFYVGAQGSQRARDLRNRELATLGTDPALLARLHGPVGLIPSARDPGTLAVSVLAEVLATAMQGAE